MKCICLHIILDGTWIFAGFAFYLRVSADICDFSFLFASFGFYLRLQAYRGLQPSIRDQPSDSHTAQNKKSPQTRAPSYSSRLLNSLHLDSSSSIISIRRSMSSSSVSSGSIASRTSMNIFKRCFRNVTCWFLSCIGLPKAISPFIPAPVTGTRNALFTLPEISIFRKC